MTTAKYAIQHLVYELIRSGIIDGDADQDLFKEAQLRMPEIKEALLPLGATALHSAVHQAIKLEPLSEVDLDSIAAHGDTLPIQSVIQRKRLSYIESVAVIFFLRHRNAEMDSTVTETWLDQETVDTGIMQACARAYAEREETNLKTKVIPGVINRLIDHKLLAQRRNGDKVEYRGTKALVMGVSLDALREFEQLCRSALEADLGPEGDSEEQSDLFAEAE